MAQRAQERTALLTQADGRSWTITTEELPFESPQWILENVEGWFGGSGVRAVVTDRLRHGEFPTRGYREGRVLSLKGSVSCATPDEADLIERELSAVLWSGEEGTLAVKEATDRYLAATVRLDGVPTVNRLDELNIRFLIPLRSSDPFLYGEDRTVFLQPVGTGIGLRYPWFGGTGELPTPVRRNMIKNPLGDLMWTMQGWRYTAYDLLTVEEDEGRPVGQILENGESSGLYIDPDTNFTPPVGTVVSFSVDLKVTAPAAQMGIRLSAYNGATATDTGLKSRAQTPEDGWVRHSLVSTITAMPEGAHVRTLIWPPNDTFPAGEGWMMRNALLEYDSPDPGVYFDGYSENASWAGTPGNSESILWDYSDAGAGPLDYGAAVETQDTVENRGNSTAYPSILVVGDFPGGFRITVDGHTIEWPWPTVPQAPVQIETTGSVWIGPNNVTDRATVRQWWSIPPGGKVTAELAPLQGGSGWAEIHQRDTYI